jgi:hypothetical protein
MRANNVSSTAKQTIYAPFCLETARHSTEEKGLLDSGASHNFIDIRTAIRLGLGTKKLKQSRKVTNVDGTTNRSGEISKYANLTITYQGKVAELPFYIMNLGRDRIILGLPWFQTFEPTIAWKEGTLLGEIKAQTATKITEINKTTLASEWAIAARKDHTNNIPPQYQGYTDVFSEEKAKRFPPSRDEDHEIKFTEDVPKFFKNHVYSMPKEQTTFLRSWINEELEKGFIRPSKSQYPSPTFLIKKKNNDYRVVQDYQQLNKYTIPDQHPLPLITELIEQLHGKQLFTKFDIRMGYNNI